MLGRLLDPPRWKGKIAMDEEMYCGMPLWLLVWEERAQRFMKAPATGYPTPHWKSVPDCATYGSGVSMAMVLAHYEQKNEGTRSPVEWVTTLDPVTVSLHPIKVAAKAPHSNAAKLFIDFVLSKEDSKSCQQSVEHHPDLDRHQNAGKESKAFPHFSGTRRELQPIPKRIPRTVSLTAARYPSMAPANGRR